MIDNLPHPGGHNRRQGPRHENGNPDKPSPPESLVHDKRKDHAKDELRSQRSYCDRAGHPQRVEPARVVCEGIEIVAEPKKDMWGIGKPEVDFPEAEPERVTEWVERHKDDREDCWQDQDQGKPGLKKFLR